MIAVLMTVCVIGAQLGTSRGSSFLFPDDKRLIAKLRSSPNAISTRNSFVNFNSNDNECQIRNGPTGTCVLFQECRELLDYVQTNGFSSSQTLPLLRSRICRFVGRSVKVCCAPEKTLPVVTNPVSPVPIDGSSIVPTMDQCGSSTSLKIIDGDEITQGSHPWLVGLGHFGNGDDDYINKCGGTLITRRHVISASHCFVRQPGNPILPSHVLLGEHSLSQNLRGEQRTLIKIASRISPGYNPTSHINDIELITLERDIGFSSAIRPACLPFQFQETNFVGKDMMVVGWGDTEFRSNMGNDVPLGATIKVATKTQCREAFIQNPEVPLDNTQLCVGGENTKDACQGDSGGPLMFVDNEDTRLSYIMGIVSIGARCGTVGVPGIYTFVPEFVDWIKENLS